jgi:nitrite reductase (cytochrome c-552)
MDENKIKDQMKEILKDIRKAQWRWDFAAAGHGNSFHSPVETGRIISGGIGYAQDARVKLARLLATLGYNQEVPFPDIKTKEKAQKYIGLDMNKLRAEKKIFIEKVIPEWDKAGKAREESQ